MRLSKTGPSGSRNTCCRAPARITKSGSTGQPVAGGEQEPIYGPTYLPRKFKAAFVVPPVNDVDVFAQDLGFVAIAANANSTTLDGFNVTAGGGLGATHGDAATYPRLADILGFITPDQLLAVAEAVVTTQRDHGDRSNRKHARLKYTIETLGLDAFRAEVERRAGIQFQPARRVIFTSNGDRFGWTQSIDGSWALTLRIPSGRIADRPAPPGDRDCARSRRSTPARSA